MKTRNSALNIVLRELPADGRDFEFTRESGELNDILKDVVGQHPYAFSFRLTPVGNTFDLRGRLTATIERECAVCTTPFLQEIVRPLHEYILIEAPLEKRDHVTKANHAHEWEENGPDYTVLESDTFRVGDFAHEALALAEPTRPLCAPELAGGCAHRDELPERTWLSYDVIDPGEATLRANPFQILEKVKLKS